MPANGMINAAVFDSYLRESATANPAAAPSGSAVRIRISAVPNSRAKSTPAIAAARGVVSLRIWRSAL